MAKKYTEKQIRDAMKKWCIAIGERRGNLKCYKEHREDLIVRPAEYSQELCDTLFDIIEGKETFEE